MYFRIYRIPVSADESFVCQEDHELSIRFSINFRYTNIDQIDKFNFQTTQGTPNNNNLMKSYCVNHTVAVK